MTSGEATTVVAAPARTAHPYDEWYERRWRVVSLFLVLLLVAIGGTAFVAGEKKSSFGDLTGAIVDGDVHQVEISGLATGDGWTSSTGVIRWSERVDHYTVVTIVRGEDRGSSSTDDRYVVEEDPRDLLLALDPGLWVEESSEVRIPGSTVAGWTGPQAMWWMFLVAVIAVLVLIISGPEPRRATRWAWFWMFTMALPVGLVAYVLLAGPVVHPAPADPRRRLTGGWAFLLSWLVLGSLVGDRAI